MCRCDRNNENIILCNEDDDSIIIKVMYTHLHNIKKDFAV